MVNNNIAAQLVMLIVALFCFFTFEYHLQTFYSLWRPLIVKKVHKRFGARLFDFVRDCQAVTLMPKNQSPMLASSPDIVNKSIDEIITKLCHVDTTVPKKQQPTGLWGTPLQTPFCNGFTDSFLLSSDFENWYYLKTKCCFPFCIRRPKREANKLPEREPLLH